MEDVEVCCVLFNFIEFADFDCTISLNHLESSEIFKKVKSMIFLFTIFTCSDSFCNLNPLQSGQIILDIYFSISSLEPSEFVCLYLLSRLLTIPSNFLEYRIFPNLLET